MTPLPLTRRDVLKAAAGLGLSFLLPGLSPRAAERRGKERPKSLITLWMAGGPSQLETWDPHPGAKIGGETRAIPTTLSGLRVADFYPRMAEEIQHLSVIRSIVSKEGDHERGTYLLKTGYRPAPGLVHPSIGAVLAHQLRDKTVQIPMHVSLGSGPWPARGGFLGDEYDAFKVFDPGRNLENLETRVPDKRQQRRLEGLDVVSRTFLQGRRIRAERTLHQHTVDEALVMMSSEQLKAFDIEQEPTTVRDAYGDSTFGRGCLVARRLVEQGVRAIEVTLDGFDSHVGNYETHKEKGGLLDPAFAALARDLKQRDLFDSTVVLCIGEFGRTPNVNPAAGRDHWPTGFSCVLGGGGLKSGVVIGETDPTGEKIDPTDPIAVADIYATIYQRMGVDYEQEYMTRIARPIAFSEGTPIERLL